MKAIGIIALLALIIPGSLRGQINWTKHVLSNTFEYALAVYAIDFDQDGDLDVLGSASVEATVAWWENDGNENFTQRTITTSFLGACWVHAADLDGDNDLDAFTASQNLGDVAWFENDGSMNFSMHIVTDSLQGARCVHAIDLDEDGDMDIVGGANNINSADDVLWWENDGSENFTEHDIISNFDALYEVSPIDLDRDDDIDLVISGASNWDRISWLENDGSENFTENIIVNGYNDACGIHPIDLDRDNDIDVVGAAYIDDDVSWFDNDGGENFTEITVDGGYDGAYDVFSIDMDNDNDIDIIASSINETEFAWWENDGSQIFSKHTIDDTMSGAAHIFAIDLDEDGDVDVIGTGRFNNQIVWWESDLNPTGIETINFMAYQTASLIQLTWQTPIPNNHSHYRIERSQNPENDYVQIAIIPNEGHKHYIYKDTDVQSGIAYYYRLGVVSNNGETTWHGPIQAMVHESNAHPSLSVTPNPFATTATIALCGMLHGAERVQLGIYDITGRRIRNLVFYPSSLILETTWDGRDETGRVVSTGVYFLSTPGNTPTKVIKVIK